MLPSIRIVDLIRKLENELFHCQKPGYRLIVHTEIETPRLQAPPTRLRQYFLFTLRIKLMDHRFTRCAAPERRG